MTGTGPPVRHRAVCYDLTHLAIRLLIRAPSGIDKVDLAYARYFADHDRGPVVHYGWSGVPQVFRQHRLARLVEDISRRGWADVPRGPDPQLALVADWLAGRAGDRPRPRAAGSREREHAVSAPRELARRLRLLISGDGLVVPPDAIYLNVAQALLEKPRYFRWLATRPDVRSVFFIHDLLPLDFPEFWPDQADRVFARRIETALAHGRAFIVTSNVVRDRLAGERTRRGLPPAAIHVAPLPSSLGHAAPAMPQDFDASRHPYFVILGTIEPRKNHLLLLNIWRRLAEQGGRVPKLLVVGARGWENEQVLDVLDRSVLVRPHVLEVSGLASPSLTALLANARALLMPSFAEGYGLPVVEALTLGTPVVASDLSIFAEVGQGCAQLIHPLDGLAWKAAIETLAGDNAEARRRAAAFRAPEWESYFAGLETFLQSL